MFPSGQDPNDRDGARGGDVPAQGGFSDLGAHLNAMRPDAPTPKKIMVVRTLMFIGGACGLGLALMMLLSLSVPQDAMQETLDEQARLMNEQQGVEVDLDVSVVRSLMTTMLTVTGIYGVLSLVLASRIRSRTVGVFWGVVAFQGLAAALLTLALVSGDFLMLVPLGFTVTMIVFMLSKEGRAHYGLL